MYVYTFEDFGSSGFTEITAITIHRIFFQASRDSRALKMVDHGVTKISTPSTGSGLFLPFGGDLEQILGQIVSLRVKTLSNINLVASRHIKREKSSHPVDERHSKASLLIKLNN